MLMSLAELATAVERNCNLTVVVANDAALSLIDVKQQGQQMASNGVQYPAINFARTAEGLGCKAWSVGLEEPLDVPIREALAHLGPSVVDVRIDASGYADQLTALRG